MCGVSGIAFKRSPFELGFNQEEIETMVDNLLLGIESRGRHATGVVSSRGRKVRMEKMPKEASDFIKVRRPVVRNPRLILLHTRFATQGHQSRSVNNHPVKFGDTYAIHNGHVSNDKEIFEELGVERTAEVDSQAIAALFDHYGLEKAHIPMQKLEGGVATAVISPLKMPDTLILAKGESSPCVVFENSSMIVWASERSALEMGFESVFGLVPGSKSLKYFSSGDLMMIQNGESEMLKFEPKKRTYNSYQSSGNKPFVSWADRQKTCRCKHKRDDHDGAVWRGFCLETDCKCTSFIEPSKDLVVPGKQVTTGSPELTKTIYRSSGDRYEVDYDDHGYRTVRRILKSGVEILYSVCITCDHAYEKTTLNLIYDDIPLCSNCFVPQEGEMGAPLSSVPAPEIVEMMIGNSVTEEIDEDVDDLIVSYALGDTYDLEEEILLAELVDEKPELYRDIAVAKVVETLHYDEETVNWLLFDMTEDEADDEQYGKYRDEVMDEYKESFTELVQSTKESLDEADSCGVRTFMDADLH